MTTRASRHSSLQAALSLRHIAPSTTLCGLFSAHWYLSLSLSLGAGSFTRHISSILAMLVSLTSYCPSLLVRRCCYSALLYGNGWPVDSYPALPFGSLLPSSTHSNKVCCTNNATFECVVLTPFYIIYRIQTLETPISTEGRESYRQCSTTVRKCRHRYRVLPHKSQHPSKHSS